MSIIYLEGPDGTGKTTLARELVRQAGGRYYHDTYKPDQWRQSSLVLGAALRHAMPFGRVSVLDRGWMGEAIYHRVYRKRVTPGAWTRWHHGLLQGAAATTVLALPLAVSAWLANYRVLEDTGREMYRGNMDEVYRRYMCVKQNVSNDEDDYLSVLAEGFPLQVEHYDYLLNQSPTALSEYAELLLERARGDELAEREAQGELWGARLHSGSCRNTWMKTLVVGERSNDPEGPMPHPFFSNRASSRYLARALNRARIPQTDIVMVNAFDPDGTSFALRNLIFKPWERIITLGRTASDQVRFISPGAGIAEVPHPQYWSRFHHGNLDGYANKLAEAFGG